MGRCCHSRYEVRDLIVVRIDDFDGLGRSTENLAYYFVLPVHKRAYLGVQSSWERGRGQSIRVHGASYIFKNQLAEIYELVFGLVLDLVIGRGGEANPSRLTGGLQSLRDVDVGTH